MVPLSQKAILFYTDVYNSLPLKQFEKGDCVHQLFVAVTKCLRKSSSAGGKSIWPMVSIHGGLELLFLSLWQQRAAWQRTYGTAKSLYLMVARKQLGAPYALQGLAFDDLTPMSLYLPKDPPPPRSSTSW